MEAWVIKRDDGKYLSKYVNYDYSAYKKSGSWTDNIYNARLFKSMNDAVLCTDRYPLLEYDVEIKKVNLTIEEVKYE